MLKLVQLFGFTLLGMAVGMSFVVQQVLNTNLRGCLGSASWAAFVSYLGGVITMLVVLLVIREPWLSAVSVHQKLLVDVDRRIFRGHLYCSCRRSRAKAWRSNRGGADRCWADANLSGFRSVWSVGANPASGQRLAHYRSHATHCGSHSYSSLSA